MLSINAMASNQVEYYLSLSREDYYLEGGEPPGKWSGRGAERLGLSATVEREHLRSLFAGFGVNGDALVQNAGKEDRQPGWDLTFSAPKTVSILWALADEGTRKAIQEAHALAVREGLLYLEDEASISRRGKGGMDRERAGLVVAAFEHGTSRAHDPQLHTHCLVMNVTARGDGTTGTLVSKPLYQHKMAAGAIYRAELQAQLERTLGLETVPGRISFELKGIPKAVVDDFSKRRKQIEKYLDTNKLETASVAAFAALATREAKKAVPPRKELFAKWQKSVEEFGFNAESAQALLHRAAPRDLQVEMAGVFQKGLRNLSEKKTRFVESDLVRQVAEVAQSKGFDATAIRNCIREGVKNNSQLKKLDEPSDQSRFTTTTGLASEKRMFDSLKQLNRSRSHITNDKLVEGVTKRRSSRRFASFEELKHHAEQFGRVFQKQKTKPLDRERIAQDVKLRLTKGEGRAIRSLSQARGAVKILAGGKAEERVSALATCRELWQKAGYRVLGAAPSKKDALVLEASTGIQSFSTKGYEFLLDPPLSRRIGHHAQQLVRALFKKQTYPAGFVIGKQTALIIDQAEKLSPMQMAKFVEAARKGGGLLVLAGDLDKDRSIFGGAPFREVAERVGHVELVPKQAKAQGRQMDMNISRKEKHKPDDPDRKAPRDKDSDRSF